MHYPGDIIILLKNNNNIMYYVQKYNQQNLKFVMFMKYS